MKKLFYFLTLIIFFILSGKGITQTPAYTLRADNVHYNYYRDKIEWDIYILHTNPPTVFEYSAGQYILNFDKGLIVDGGTLTFSIVGSDLPPNLVPRNPTVYLAGGEHQLRLAANIPPLPGNGFIMTNNSNSNGGSGTLIARVRLSTTTHFETIFYDPQILWRNGPSSPYTKVYSYVGTTFTEITNPDTHLANVTFPGHTGQFAIAMLTYSPSYGSTGISFPVDLRWSGQNFSSINKTRCFYGLPVQQFSI